MPGNNHKIRSATKILQKYVNQALERWLSEGDRQNLKPVRIALVAVSFKVICNPSSKSVNVKLYWDSLRGLFLMSRCDKIFQQWFESLHANNHNLCLLVHC